MGTPDPRLEDLKDQIQKSTTHTRDERDYMIDTIALAEQINGDDDLVKRSQKMMMVNGVRRELRDPDRTSRIAEAVAIKIVSTAMEVHIRDCPGKKSNSVVTWKKGEGIRMSGPAAVTFASLLAFGCIVGGVIYWQHKQTRQMIDDFAHTTTISNVVPVQH